MRRVVQQLADKREVERECGRVRAGLSAKVYFGSHPLMLSYLLDLSDTQRPGGVSPQLGGRAWEEPAPEARGRQVVDDEQVRVRGNAELGEHGGAEARLANVGGEDAVADILLGHARDRVRGTGGEEVDLDAAGARSWRVSTSSSWKVS